MTLNAPRVPPDSRASSRGRAAFGQCFLTFAFRYTRLCCEAPDGGIDSNQDKPPPCSDFADMAFALGMSHAVSDSRPADIRIRRTALGQAWLACYVFGTGILS
ncbi:DUF1345 domain-containing protein [Actinomadura madurae]|uniref:DUF1345 domain-containing protein n=1 Tax=Actinomadura madurae TaxID=1993 RepID=UPI003D6B7DA6